MRKQLTKIADTLQSALIGAIIVGAALAFGGAVWWARIVLGALIVLLALTALVSGALRGRFELISSPTAAIGLLVLGLAAFQLVPLPARLAERLAPRARQAYALGMLTDLAHQDDPAYQAPEMGDIRTPISLDRSATLRWLGGAIGALVVFWVSAHHADRLRHTAVIWGAVVAALFIGTAFGTIQLLGGTEGAYGAFAVGNAPFWGPSLADWAEAPNRAHLQFLLDASGSRTSWTAAMPGHSWVVAGWPGGPGAFLALGSLALPLALGLTLQLCHARGSREPLWDRLRASNRTGVAVLLVVMTLASVILFGAFSGRWLALPLALGLLLVGAGAAWPAGHRKPALGLTGLFVCGLAGGIVLGDVFGRPEGTSPLTEAGGWSEARSQWLDASRIAQDFPMLGSGMGSYAVISPYYKHTDASFTTANSTLLQWWAESGTCGVALVGIAGVIALLRLPSAVRLVGSADRALAFGLIGAMMSFACFAAVHWTVELGVVGLAVAAVAGTAERWLAGGTDLFIEAI